MMQKKKSFALFLASVLVLGSAAGCGSEESTVTPAGQAETTVAQQDDSSERAAAVTTIAPAPDFVFYETKPGDFGVSDGFGGVSVQINNAYKSDLRYTQGGQDTMIVFFDVTVENNTDLALNANMLTSYYMEVDGKECCFSTLHAIGAVPHVYGEDACQFTEPIPAGATQEGYIAAEIPVQFTDVTLYCMPLGGAGQSGDSSKALVYNLKEKDFKILS